jgi:hypothetical protein
METGSWLGGWSSSCGGIRVSPEECRLFCFWSA